ncbi:MAG TPA: endonuclease MutS2, partial [Synergistales bacterium]|nr:endonuclease MutS2 [Synergistales bacterium]
MKIEQRTADLAEITSVLERMSRRTRSEAGRSMLRGMLPAPSIKAARQRQELLKSYARYVETRGELPWDERMKPLGPLLENAGETALLSGVELLPFRILIGLSKRIKESLREARNDIPGVERLAEGIRDLDEEFEKLQVLSDDGELYDGASEKLAELRLSLRDLTSRARSRC